MTLTLSTNLDKDPDTAGRHSCQLWMDWWMTDTLALHELIIPSAGWAKNRHTQKDLYNKSFNQNLLKDTGIESWCKLNHPVKEIPESWICSFGHSVFSVAKHFFSWISDKTFCVQMLTVWDSVDNFSKNTCLNVIFHLNLHYSKDLPQSC